MTEYKSLEPLIADVPFLSNAKLIYSDAPMPQFGGKSGRGPKFNTAEERVVAEDCEKKLVSQYINAHVRAQLYLRLKDSANPISGEFFTESRPLRADTELKLINPLRIVVGSGDIGYAETVQEWLDAPFEYQFFFKPGAVQVTYSWGRKQVTDHFLYRLLIDVQASDSDIEMSIISRQ